MLNGLRRGYARYLLLSAVLVTVLVCVYWNYGSGIVAKDIVSKLARKTEDGEPPPPGPPPLSPAGRVQNEVENNEVEDSSNPDMWSEPDIVVSGDVCPGIKVASTNVNTVEQFGQFEFQPNWMQSKEYWDKSFEARYHARKEKWSKLPLKVVVVPHSHNDPGWLKTFESYFYYMTKHILNNMVEKMQQFENMTFIWTEISFLAQWWESAHPTKKRIVKNLLDEGRLEITTGGWVMTDEATVHVYAMLDQLIEGHQWVKNNLGITPQSGWSIDPFGHGATVPYLLKGSGISGAVIQRIHYAWKQWLAEQQMGDFLWRQNWDDSGRTDLFVHNEPFDIYSIKHSCGPHPQVCLNFDFRKIPGEYTEYSVKSVPIDDSNVKEKAELLLEQYGRTGSLFPHNVVLMPIGDDFRYDHDKEWDQQYKNYQKLFNFINQNKQYNAEISFGTPGDYFKAVKERMLSMQTLRGDFFVYSDIFSEGRPAYWSGYFTTRPYWKILDRELEANLRSAEVLYTLALNRAREQGFNKTMQVLVSDYEKLVRARQNLALFQHHDAITGTSKSFVMHDYALKLFDGIQSTMLIQSRSAGVLLSKDLRSMPKEQLTTFLLPDFDRESYEKLPRKMPIVIPTNEPKRVVVFNSLAQHRQDVVRVLTQTPNIRVLDSEGNAIPFQVNPVWNRTDKGLQMVHGDYEVMFVADLPPLSLVTFQLERTSVKSLDTRAVIYCSSCNKKDDASFVSPFEVKGMQSGDIQLENHKMKLLFDGPTGFLKAITKKSSGKTTQCGLQFAAYESAQFHSGAYLFMPDPYSRDKEHEILQDGTQEILITSGPIASELSVMYKKVLQHTIRIYHVAGPLSEGIYMENIIDFDTPPKYRETELFMRFVTDISNGDVPEFYSDLNGFQMQRRVKVERIGIEGNYFPITTMAYIQDSGRRLSLLVNHAQGAAAWQPGWLEVMIDRRMLYDDSRGMGEGVVDNKRTLSKFWLLLEDQMKPSEQYSRPSLFANYLSNSLLYPANLYVLEDASQDLHRRVDLLTKPFPCDTHLLNLRTISDPTYTQFPSASALMILQKQGYSCDIPSKLPQCGLETGTLHKRTLFRNVHLGSITRTSLTGLHSLETYKSLDEVQLQAMELATLNLTFVL